MEAHSLGFDPKVRRILPHVGALVVLAASHGFTPGVVKYVNYRNFLNLQTTVVSPKGERQIVRLEQTGPGHYEARFPTKEVGSYLLNVLEPKEGRSQVVGASVNYSPEFTSTEPNVNLLRRISESGGGKILDPSIPSVNPFLHERQKTFQPRELWDAI